MHELVLRAPQALVDAVTDALTDELEALSVSVEDADADTDIERPLFGEPGLPPPDTAWRRSTLTALFDNPERAEAAATLLLAQDWTAGLQVQGLAVVPEQDWVRVTQSQFDPIEVSQGFWIVPSWHQPPAEAIRAIRLDPGMAFGTGTHPTTRMCLRWIAQHAGRFATNGRVLDYGCGSGILAIAAALHGANHVDAVDIDPAAVEAAARNARENRVQIHCGDASLATGLYGAVLANILATPLKLLAPLLCGHVRPAGHLVLAGILARQTAELQSTYAPLLTLHVHDEEEGWVLLTGQLDASPPGHMA